MVTTVVQNQCEICEALKLNCTIHSSPYKCNVHLKGKEYIELINLKSFLSLTTNINDASRAIAFKIYISHNF